MGVKEKQCGISGVKNRRKTFPGGPLVKTPPANAGDTGSIPGLVWKDSTCDRATKPACCNCWSPTAHPRACVLQQEKPLQWEACVLQLESHARLLQLEKACTQQWRPSVAKKEQNRKETLWVLERRHNNSSFLEVNSEAVHTNRQMTGTWQGLRDLMGLDRIKRRFFYRAYDYWAWKEYEIRKDVDYT